MKSWPLLLCLTACDPRTFPDPCADVEEGAAVFMVDASDETCTRVLVACGSVRQDVPEGVIIPEGHVLDVCTQTLHPLSYETRVWIIQRGE